MHRGTVARPVIATQAAGARESEVVSGGSLRGPFPRQSGGWNGHLRPCPRFCGPEPANAADAASRRWRNYTGAMGGRQDLARLQAELDRICAASVREVPADAHAHRLTERSLAQLCARVSALEAELAHLSDRRALVGDGGASDPSDGGSERSDVAPTAVDPQLTPASDSDDANGAAAGAEDAGEIRGAHVGDIRMVADSEDGPGDGPSNGDDAPLSYADGPTSAGEAPQGSDDDGARRAVLWASFVPPALREQETMELKAPISATVESSLRRLGTEDSRKLALLTYVCTAADVVLAQLGSGRRAKCGRGASSERSSKCDNMKTALVATKDPRVYRDLFGRGVKSQRAFTNGQNLFANHARAGVRAAALGVTVPADAEASRATSGATTGPRTAFRPCESPRKCLRPSRSLGDLVTFERLVLRDDGRTLRLGPGSLLRCLATGWLASFDRCDLLLMPGGEELRVTPALLAGLLVEAEDMCTPPERKLPLAAPGHRVLRMRELFDTYVRPLTQLPDGGGVLLPQAQVETWMPGVGWLPMAFRVPKNKVPGCLFSQYGAAHRLQRPQRSGSDAPPQASSDDVADDADASGSSRDGSSSPSPTRRRGRGGCEADSRTDSGADLSPTSSPSPTQAIALRTRARENAGDGGCGEVPSTGHVRHGPSEAQTTARGLERPRNTPGGVPFIDSNQGAARLFALTFNTTRADVILALVGSGELPGLKRKYRDTAGRAPGALDACVRAVRDVSVLSDRQLGARAIISKVSKIARALRQLAEARMRKAALGFTVKGADARARGSRPAFRRADNAESARLCPATDAAHLASFKRLVLRRDGRLQLGGGSLLHCLAATCVDAIPGYGALLADSVEGQVRLTPGLLAGVLVEAEDMCTPVGEKLPSGRSKYLPRMLRMRHMYDAHVRPLMSLPDGGGVLLPQAHVAAWLPGVHWVPAAFRVPEDEIALCSVGTTLVKTVKGRRKRQRSADDDDSSHGGAGAQQLPQQRRKRRRA